MDIMWWLDAIGALNRPVESADPSVRSEPSLQLAGSPTAAPTDLPGLVTTGTHLAGHLLDVDRGVATFADDLLTTSGEADQRLDHLLARIDRYASRAGLDAEIDPPSRPDSSSDPQQPRPAAVNLARNGIRTVLWATGYRRTYPWLQLPVLDGAGEIMHQAGRTALPGLVVVGLGWQTRRNSAFIDGVGHDAATVVEHLTGTVLAAAHQGRAAA
jgi:putative flavoprotein involved in K+ transport